MNTSVLKTVGLLVMVLAILITLLPPPTTAAPLAQDETLAKFGAYIEMVRTSTSHPMEFLGEFDEAGTLEVGKRAELVFFAFDAASGGADAQAQPAAGVQ